MSKSNEEFHDLSNEDVKLLFEIIKIAQTSKTPTFRALFAAYDKVLARYGIIPDHDQVYFRFLLRMGEGLQSTENLLQQFERLLAKSNIRIELDEEEEEEIQEQQLPRKAETAGGVQSSQKNLLSSGPYPRARRASFDSAYETIPNIYQNTSDQPPRSRSHSDLYDVQHGAIPEPRRDEVQVLRRQKPILSRDWSGVNTLDRLSGSQQYGYQKKSLPQAMSRNSNYRQHHIRDRLTDHVGSNHGMLDNLNDEEDVEPQRSGNHVHDIAWDKGPKATELQMLTEAKKFEYRHAANYAHRIFHRWHLLSKQSTGNHWRMREIALARDIETLKRQALDTWLAKVQERQRAVETERFYEQLEARASRSADQFLLTKAFTHWAQHASDQVLRTSVARRHILRTRYFNAWRDITVINELKVRRLGLLKFLAIWKKRTARVCNQHEVAYLSNITTLANKFYKHWFWLFCEKRAPVWYESKVKIRYFNKWRWFLCRRQIATAQATDFQSKKLLRKVLTKGSQRARTIKKNELKASLISWQNLLRPKLETLRKELQIAPLKSRLSRKINTRVVRSALRTWLTRTRASAQAVHIDELRVTRNVWTKWNDRLRCETLSRTVDERIILQALHRWVLWERCALLERVHKENLKRSIFAHWRRRTNALCTTLGRAHLLLQDFQRRQSAKSVLQKWTILTERTTPDIVRAQTYHNKRLVSQGMQCWIVKLRNMQQLHIWAGDARFYVLTTRAIKQWHNAMVVTKREKRREVYAKLRHKLKMNTARRLMVKWHVSTTTAMITSEQAKQLHHRHLIAAATSVLDSWHSRMMGLSYTFEQAQHLHQQNLLLTTFKMFLQRNHQVEQARERADEFLRDHTDNSVTGLLRRLNWQLFQIRRQQENATSLLERNERKHYRNMIRYWSEKTAMKRNQGPAYSTSNRTTLRPTRPHDNSDQDRAGSHYAQLTGIEGWTPYPHADINRSLLHLAGNTPGYLQTPSRRRTGTARPRVQYNPKTPAAGQITPFMSRLRAQYTADEMTRSAHVGTGRSLENSTNPAMFGVQAGIEERPKHENLLGESLPTPLLEVENRSGI